MMRGYFGRDSHSEGSTRRRAPVLGSMVVEDVVVSLCGGAPWGFRLQGGAEHQRPLQVAKVHKGGIMYESAPDGGGGGGFLLHPQWEPSKPLGVPRRELVYQPPEEETITTTTTTTPTHTPHTLTPRTLTPTQDHQDHQGLTGEGEREREREREGEGEVDSGFQEMVSCVPLVSPERAKEAMALVSGRGLVPMVGPQLGPISDELSTTYVDKAKQATGNYRHRSVDAPGPSAKEFRSVSSVGIPSGCADPAATVI
ncbi:hypothetical protein CRUP_037326 [Coryphaenoides rupestris]|nr:hypothetical protein CRUP_037326 [Coryphaenoides rupestris]